MPSAEKDFHIFTEALSVFIAAPLVFYAGMTHPNENIAFLLKLFAVGFVLVDGFLLLKADEW